MSDQSFSSMSAGHASLDSEQDPNDNEGWCLHGYLPEAGEIIKIPIDRDWFRLGRGSEATFCLSRNTVSTLHAEFFREDGHLFLRDLKSTNGTYVNGERVTGRMQVTHNDLLQFGDIAFRLIRRNRVSNYRTVSQNVEDDALALAQFDKLISERAIVPYFQPIVNIDDGEIVGYEALSRSRLIGLETPERMFVAASKLNEEAELSRAMRSEALRISASFPDTPHVFLNTHPHELTEDGFLTSLKTLRKVAPTTPITIEIHESVVTNLDTMKDIRALLDDLDMRLAFDDFGAGQARLAELVVIRPHYLKFDRKIVHKIHQATAERQKMLESLVSMTKDLAVIPLAEGIESEGEAEICRKLGFELAQGFFYGKPTRIRTYS